jgi:hypothetical protein
MIGKCPVSVNIPGPKTGIPQVGPQKQDENVLETAVIKIV